MNHLSLQLFAVFLGIAFGAGLYEARVVIPLWFNRQQNGSYRVSFENLKAIDPGRKFWGFITTVPLTLLTFFNLVLAVKTSGEIQLWWLWASILALAERIMTFSYFIPTILQLYRGQDLSAAALSTKASLWIRMNYVRNVITLVAWVLVLSAITLL